MSAEIVIPAELAALLAPNSVADVSGSILSNLEYIIPLEYGHSKQAPQGMVGKYVSEYRGFIKEAFNRVYPSKTQDLQRAMVYAITEATNRAMRAIADRTPVDTGRAKGSWTASTPDGKTYNLGEQISKAQQIAILKARTPEQRTAHRDRLAAIARKRKA
jgi:hypothetical protein